MSSPPLVVHIIYALSTGGLENGLVNIINRAPPDRYRHAIICMTSADDFAGRITATGVQLYELHKREGHDLGCYRRLRRLLRELRPDIVHSRNLAALEGQLFCLGTGRARRVHGEHGREIGDLDGRNRRYLLFRRFMRMFIHRYIAVSQDLQQWLVDGVHVRRQKVTQIYNGVDHQRFVPTTVKPLSVLPAHWRDQDDILVVGTVGRLTPVKDQQLLLHAVARICRERPALGRRLRAIIVGDGPLWHELGSLVEQLGLAGQVWLAGDRDDVPALLPALDVFVLPSLGEGISNTILEAMACGLPVVATAVGGNVELVQEGVNGMLVPVGDVQALAGALCSLLEDDDRRQLLGQNAHRRVSREFDWSRTVEEYLAVYDQVLDLAR